MARQIRPGQLQENVLYNISASFAISASHEITHELSSSYAETASFAVTASHLLNNPPAFPFTGSAGISGSLIVNSNSTSETLRITQIGTGDAIRIEDSSNPDSTPTVITKDGDMFIGSSSAVTTVGGLSPKLYIKNGSSGYSGDLAIDTAMLFEGSGATYFGTLSPDNVVSGLYMGSPSDVFGSVIRWGYDAGNLQLIAASVGHGITFQVGNKPLPSLSIIPNISSTSDYNAIVQVTGSVTVLGSVTASANISSSGTIVASNLSGTNTGDQDLSSFITNSQTASFAITASDVIFTNLTASNNILINGGGLDIKNSGAQSYARFYCESGNAHYTELKAQPHSLFSGNPTMLLPAYDLDFSKPKFQANITASGDISASGDLEVGNIKTNDRIYLDWPTTTAGNYIEFNTTKNAAFFKSALSVLSNITSSGNISSSGDLIGNQLVLAGGTFTSASLAAGGGGTTVVANPGGSPGTALTTITIAGSDFSVGSGGGSAAAGTVSGSAQITALGFVTSSATASFSNVVANPGSSGGGALSTVTIDGTSFSVGGGGGGSSIFTASNGYQQTINNLIISQSNASSSLSVINSGSTVFDVQGSVGQLFEVADGLDGVLMSVNDISGIPILTVSSSGDVFLAAGSTLQGTAATASFVPGVSAAFPFTGSGAISGSLNINGSGSGIFDIDGTVGQLFSVNDGLDGILMSVNDISGLPLFEVSSSGHVEIHEGNISGSAASTASFGTYLGDGSQLTNLQRPITASSVNFSASINNAGYYFRTGGNVTCSIGTTSATGISIGTEYEFFQTASAGYLCFTTASGVTLNSKSGKTKLAGQFSAATLKKVATDTYDLIGDLG